MLQQVGGAGKAQLSQVSHYAATSLDSDPLLVKEVLFAIRSGNKSSPLCRYFKPSDGLEPSTSSLP
jgi:hypothetical protein